MGAISVVMREGTWSGAGVEVESETEAVAGVLAGAGVVTGSFIKKYCSKKTEDGESSFCTILP